MPVSGFEFVPGRPAADVDVGAEAQRVHGCTDRAFDRTQRGEVDDRDHLARYVGEAESGRMQHPRWPAQLAGAEAGEEALDLPATCEGTQIAARRLAAIQIDDQRVADLVEPGAQPGEALVAHQHQVALLGLMARRFRVEAGGAVLNGVEPIGRQRRAHREPGALERLGAQALDRVAPD
jgi:hypothetical protein